MYQLINTINKNKKFFLKNKVGYHADLTPNAALYCKAAKSALPPTLSFRIHLHTGPSKSLIHDK